MAKRFGRNRRRHLREEAAKGRAAVKTYNDRLWELNCACVDWVKAIADLYGANSAFLPEPPKIYLHGGNEFPLTRLATESVRLDPMLDYELNHNAVEIRHQIIDSWYSLSEPDRMRAAALVRLIQVKGDHSLGEQFCYSLSDHEIMTVRDFEYLAHMVGKKMLRHLKDHYWKHEKRVA